MSPDVHVRAMGFPYLLQDPNLTTAADILDRLTTHPGLLQGNDLVACCLDNWRALREEMDSWRYLKKPWIEGKVLVETVNRWLKNAQNQPHRMDMLVRKWRSIPHSIFNPGKRAFRNGWPGLKMSSGNYGDSFPNCCKRCSNAPNPE